MNIRIFIYSFSISPSVRLKRTRKKHIFPGDPEIRNKYLWGEMFQCHKYWNFNFQLFPISNGKAIKKSEHKMSWWDQYFIFIPICDTESGLHTWNVDLLFKLVSLVLRTAISFKFIMRDFCYRHYLVFILTWLSLNRDGNYS